ncbi:MAG: Hsp20/alpha crystallin family protein [Chloroflexi bacterium]|nr:Hsp20/alpha crystallin family protein [Chloroflexota bacterium]
MSTVNLKPGNIHNSGYHSEEPAYMLSSVAGWRLTIRTHVWRPPTDLYETEDSYVVRVEIPGMNESEFTISIDENILIISGIRPDVGEHRAYHQMEIRYGEFSTELEIPGPIVVDQVEAEYQDGFLRLSMPKARPTQIQVNDR